MGHERKLRWDEVRIFAEYNAQGIKKSAFVQTYELSNEQTVVRWGQQVVANPLLVVQSSVQKGEDFTGWLGRSMPSLRSILVCLCLISVIGQQYAVLHFEHAMHLFLYANNLMKFVLWYLYLSLNMILCSSVCRCEEKPESLLPCSAHFPLSPLLLV